MTNTATLNTPDPDKDEKAFLRFFNKALIFQSNNQYPQAIEYYEKAVSLKPDYLPTRQVLGYLYQATEQYTEALIQYRHAIKLHEYSATLQNSAGLCEELCRNLPAAKYHYKMAIQLEQNSAESLNNLGNVCRKLGEYEVAEKYLLEALRLNISIETLANLGLVMEELGKLSLALSFYEHALRLQPDNPQLNWNKSLVLLSQGHFDQGWFLYDQGKFAKTRSKQISPQVTDKSEFSIEYFRDKSVYIRGEQGIGDEIMFASCIPDILAVATKCTIECDGRLLLLFQRSFPEASVVGQCDPSSGKLNVENTDADVVISMGSLPRFVRRNYSDFPPEKAFLYSSNKAEESWRQRYTTKQKSVNIGISWKGGINDESRRRSTELNAWTNILSIKNINFVNLQYGDISDEKEIADKYLTEWPDTNHYHDIEQLAAQISALDLVITVSNATAHLAGALGVPVFILLPHSPNWRWFMGKNPSPWYGSATLFTQKKTDDWKDVFEAIEHTLISTCITEESSTDI
ncbi:MAG: tetratricopeptide repeat protein [Gammaproteobacteria bacterium]|nr:tetratricopeptide repeat protein [Gammaproteobacteria bacterium]